MSNNLQEFNHENETARVMIETALLFVCFFEGQSWCAAYLLCDLILKQSQFPSAVKTLSKSQTDT